MATEFEGARSNFENNIEQARDAIGDMNLATKLEDRKQLLIDSRKLLEECKRNISQMDYLWGTLDPSDKGYYKSELIEFKDQLENIQKDFKQYEQAIKRDEDDEESDELSKLQANTREKLLKGVGNLSDQDKQLNGIVKNGIETTEILREGNRNLVGQRDYIENAGRNNLRAQRELSKADKVVTKMRL